MQATACFSQTVDAHIGQGAGVGFVGFVQIVRTDIGGRIGEVEYVNGKTLRVQEFGQRFMVNAGGFHKDFDVLGVCAVVFDQPGNESGETCGMVGQHFAFGFATVRAVGCCDKRAVKFVFGDVDAEDLELHVFLVNAVSTGIAAHFDTIRSVIGGRYGGVVYVAVSGTWVGRSMPPYRWVNREFTPSGGDTRSGISARPTTILDLLP